MKQNATACNRNNTKEEEEETTTTPPSTKTIRNKNVDKIYLAPIIYCLSLWYSTSSSIIDSSNAVQTTLQLDRTSRGLNFVASITCLSCPNFNYISSIYVAHLFGEFNLCLILYVRRILSRRKKRFNKICPQPHTQYCLYLCTCFLELNPFSCSFTVVVCKRSYAYSSCHNDIA